MDSFIRNSLKHFDLDISEKMFKNSIYNTGNRTLIKNAMDKAANGNDVTIAFFGGSITAGASCNVQPNSFKSSLSDSKTYCRIICDWWDSVFGKFGAKAIEVNAGIGATDTPYATHRIVDDIFPHNPDIIFLEWACNDGARFPYKQGTYESLVRKLLDKGIAVILFEMCTGTKISSQSVHEPIAKHYDLPMISYLYAYADMPKFAELSPDTVHPNRVGHMLAALINIYYLSDIYNNIDTINDGSIEIPNPYNAEADYYTGSFVASFSDIENGKYDGIRIIDKGSFIKDEGKTQFAFKSYYGYTASFSENYSPMVIEIKNCKTLFIEELRDKLIDASYEVEINGEIIKDETFTSSNGTNDNKQIEMRYHWATNRICYYENGKDIILKIIPTNKSKNSHIKLFALLVSQKQ